MSENEADVVPDAGVTVVLAAALQKSGVPEPMASNIARMVAEFGDDVRELVEARIEAAHASTFLAYVQAGVALLSIEDGKFVMLGKEVLDVANGMFEDAVDAEKAASAAADPGGGALDPSIFG